MNRSQLKTYAPQARLDFIQAMKDRAAFYGLTANTIEPVVERGDVAVIAGREHPRAVAKTRQQLAHRITQHGFQQTMEALAYTWFNRFVAIRYMELHGYFDHGYRVLSHPEGHGHPEILDHAADVHLPGLDRARAVALKLDGTQDEVLYRLLLTAQCNALHQAMPFLFERIGDETELLLPANLLHTDSLISRLVKGIDENAWAEIEVIGWLYQFYVAEKKAQVIGKVVPSEDIPAATQLFTPNWIVQYMVQNSLGSTWLATYPDSPLKGQMAYYIEPAEQAAEVKRRFAAITPSTLNPEELTLIDPASGSGHILVDAYELFKAIYLERGYRQRDVAQLILEKNLFGLDIDRRAVQLTGFALMMKGRADDQRLFGRGVTLNVMALMDSTGLDVERLGQRVKLADYGLKPRDLMELKQLFQHATTCGSLIQVPEALAAKLPALRQLGEVPSHDLFVSEALKHVRSLVQQAELLAAQYDAVVVNPPYMGSKGMNAVVKQFAKDHFPDAKTDLFACFIERGCTLAKEAGHTAMVTMQSWMFLSSFQKMRERILREKTIGTMAHLGARAFGSISGEVVQTTAFVLKNSLVGSYKPAFFRLLAGDEEEKRTALASREKRFDATAQDEFKNIPGSPLAYWLPLAVFSVFIDNACLGEGARAAKGLVTADNNTFVRQHWEVSDETIGYRYSSRADAKMSGRQWFPYAKGGRLRRWGGNLEEVVNWTNDGEEIQTTLTKDRSRVRATNFNLDRIFIEGASWTVVTSGDPSFRFVAQGHLFDAAAGVIQGRRERSITTTALLAYLNSSVVRMLLGALNPTLNLHPGYLEALPGIRTEVRASAEALAQKAVSISEADWNAYERSWDFKSLPMLTASSGPTPTLEASYATWITANRATIAEMKRLEEENNRLFIDAYGLAEELTPDVPTEQITLTVNPAYRYGGTLTDEEQWTRFREDTMAELISYAIGCMMGRYSRDEPSLIYARNNNVGFDLKRYTTFPADDDGIVPLTDNDWFDDDAVHRLIEFLSVAWDAKYLENNLAFLADSLRPKSNESSRDTIRRYLCDSFFTDHLQTYKKRPIYWLFSSGKQKAFQCLVYLHRYHDGTLARIRTKYVIPLQGQIASRIDHLKDDILTATSTSHHRKLLRAQDDLKRQQAELVAFDEKLRHAADQKISLDLHDGVKVNYAKFGDLLAEAQAITGGKGGA